MALEANVDALAETGFRLLTYSTSICPHPSSSVGFALTSVKFWQPKEKAQELGFLF